MPSAPVAYRPGDTVTVAGNSNADPLVKTGYTFSGWNSAPDASGTNYAAADTFVIAGDITLYAKWIVTTYTIGTGVIGGNGSSGGSAPSDAAGYLPGATVAVSATAGTLVKTGYSFAGWNSAPDGSGTNYGATFAIAGNTTLYAQWLDIAAPAANAETASTTYNTAKLAIDVLVNDTDNSGTVLLGTVSSQVGGTCVVNAGKIDFTPTSGLSGAASCVYQVKDPTGNISTATLTVNVAGDVTAPAANPETVSTTYNTAKTAIDVLANDADNSGTVLLGTVSSQVGGTCVVNAGKIDFTPTSGLSGAASCVYEVKDPAGNISTATLTVNVAGDVTAPVANPETASTAYNTAKTAIDVLANDADNSGTVLLGTISSQVGGTCVVNAGKIDFTPTSGFSGAASCVYQVKDPAGNISTATLTVNVAGDVTAPVANPETASTAYNTAKTAIDVLANDADNSGTVLLGTVSSQIGGTYVVNAGKIDFTPTSGLSGAASCVYQVKDPAGNSATATLTVNVAGDVTAPVANPETASTTYNTAKSAIDVLANDADNSGTVLLGTVSSQVGGTCVVNAGKLDFTPTSGFSGAASCVYEVKDPAGNSATATLTVNVSAMPSYNVTYNGNGNSGGSVPADNSSYANSATVTVLGSGTLQKAGYTFAGWNSAANGSGINYAPLSTFAIGAADVTLYARWSKTFTVTMLAGIGSSITPPMAQTVTNGATTSITIVPISGYGIHSVSGCNGTLSGSTYTTGAIYSDCQVTTSAVKHNGNSSRNADPSIADALFALQAYSGMVTLLPAEQIRYDVAPFTSTGVPQGDGSVDIADVIMILRRSVGIGSW